MSDFSDRKSSPIGQYPDSNENSVVGDGEGVAGFTRVEPFVTPERMKDEWLFGIPLRSLMTRQELKDETIKRIISKAAGKVELDCRIDVFPVVRTVRKEFDKTKYIQGFNQLNLGVRNIRTLLELSIRTVSSESFQDGVSSLQGVDLSQQSREGDIIYNVPLAWVDMTYARKGILHLVPLQTAYSGTGLAGGVYNGAASALFAVFSKLQWIPSFWSIKFESGFSENAIPSIVNDLIGCYAAMEILSMLAPLNRVNSQSIGLDGASQSTSGPGIQIYGQRYQELQAKAAELKDVIRAWFSNKLYMDAI